MMVAAYHLIVANNGNNAQRLHSKVLGCKGRAGTLVAKHDVRVNVGIEVFNAEALNGILECGLPLATGVI